MRRFILIAAMLLISACARADGLRGLSLAANETVAAAQPNAAEATKAVGQPSPSDAVAQPPKADQTKSASGKAEKPKLKRSPIEARVVDELHRHGIYW